MDAEAQGEDVLSKIRDFPEGTSPEDTMRELLKGSLSARRSTVEAIEYLYRIMEEEGPFDGIIGYSEGATVAATLLLHEQRRAEQTGVPSMFKYAIFFAGWPPMNPDLTAMVLSDDTDMRIEIPTCHISKCLITPPHLFRMLTCAPSLVGSLDPYLAGSMALYNVCDPDTAYLFDHAKGHTLPRDKHTVKELGDVIRLGIADLELTE